MTEHILNLVKGIAEFTSVYWFSKCMKTLLCGLCLIPIILLARKVLRKKSAVLSCYLWLLLVPMTLMGMSKLFYQRYFWYVTGYLGKYAKFWHGYLYFGVMFALLLRFFIKNIRFRRALKKMPQIYDTSVTNSNIKNIKIYASDMDASPFSSGIIRPYIVVPKAVWERLDEESRRVIIAHELAHIRLGHIVLLTLMKLLTFLWWINPMIYLCEKLLKEDIEQACDAYTIAGTGITKYAYGCVLLEMAEHFCGRTDVAVASFINRNDFDTLKARIKGIGVQTVDKKRIFRQRRIGFAAALCIVLLASGVIAATSYPRYSVINEIYVYGEDLRPIANDTPAINEAFCVENRTLFINAEAFERFLEEECISDKYIYVSFGTVMKLPGFGGGGDVVMVNARDIDDTFSITAPTLENRLVELLLKCI